MSEIVIHIGTHKTGTTAIQSFFHQNRKALGDTGFWYPGYNLIDKKNHPAHLGMANALVNEHKRFSQKDAEDFFKLVAKKSKSYDYTFISAEPLYRHYLNSGNFSAHQDKQAYWESRELFIKYFLSFFTNCDASIVLVLREHASYAQSLYQEHIKSTRYKGNFKDFLTEFWFHFDYLNQIHAWEKLGHKVNVLSYSKLGKKEGLIHNFIDSGVFGNPEKYFAELDTSERRSNAAIFSELVILKRMLHSSAMGREAIEELIKSINSNLSHSSRLKHCFFDNQEHLLRWTNQFENDKQLIIQRYNHEKEISTPFFEFAHENYYAFGDNFTEDEGISILKSLTGLLENKTN
ncbi:MAG: hypothetical protein RLO12_21105 [Fulvivirga sp.]